MDGAEHSPPADQVPPDFSCELFVDEVPAVVLVSGEVDFASVPKLRECLDQLIDRELERVDLDLRNVRFMDSVGLGLLVATHKRLEAIGGTLRILHPQVFVLKVLKVSGVDRFLEVISGPG